VNSVTSVACTDDGKYRNALRTANYHTSIVTTALHQTRAGSVSVF